MHVTIVFVASKQLWTTQHTETTFSAFLSENGMEDHSWKPLEYLKLNKIMIYQRKREESE